MTLAPHAHTLFFWLFATLLTGAAVLVISLRNPAHSVLLLVLCFFLGAALWMLLTAEFLALLLILIYVGAVMVLFLFVVMMLDINLTDTSESFIHHLWIGVSVSLLLAAGMVKLLQSNPDTTMAAAEHFDAATLGRLLFTDYLIPFEIAGALLLVAIIAAIAMNPRPRRPLRRHQDPAAQAATAAADQVRLVDLRQKQ